MRIRPATINDLTTLLDLEQQVIEAERPYNAAIKSQDAKYYDLEKLNYSRVRILYWLSEKCQSK